MSSHTPLVICEPSLQTQAPISQCVLGKELQSTVAQDSIAVDVGASVETEVTCNPVETVEELEGEVVEEEDEVEEVVDDEDVVEEEDEVVVEEDEEEEEEVKEVHGGGEVVEVFWMMIGTSGE